MKITFLGTGTSHGVPTLDCMISDYIYCRKNVCQESGHDPKHNRSRSSLLIDLDGKHVLIDVSPDFKHQAFREKMKKIDAVLITHIHADHIMGIPDMRSYSRLLQHPLPVYGSEESILGIKSAFDYIFNPNTIIGGGIPNLACQIINSDFKLLGKRMIPVLVEHGNLNGCYGYRIGNTAYIPDMKSIGMEQKKKLQNLDCLIINCLRDVEKHSTHMILPESIALARELRPRQCYFIHMTHDIHYQQDSDYLDSWMTFSYDGLQIECY